jgi:hypothetical protein
VTSKQRTNNWRWFKKPPRSQSELRKFGLRSFRFSFFELPELQALRPHSVISTRLSLRGSSHVERSQAVCSVVKTKFISISVYTHTLYVITSKWSLRTIHIAQSGGWVCSNRKSVSTYYYWSLETKLSVANIASTNSIKPGATC